MLRAYRNTALVLAATSLVGGAGVGVAQASSATTGVAPSACRPANHTAKITKAPDSAGHRHYRVTLTAPRGYDPCRLAGSPTDVRFSHHGSRSSITTGRYGVQKHVVTFGPGHPVHFDIQVPGSGHAITADEATFTLQAPGGEIPGTSFARGALKVTNGTRIGPVERGA
ncbi:hypothetical protein ACFV3R_12020 [Streptomyces sp. NPDC059740]|uniref:hypothetical protein n=1 Tax=Streptomyces sp. NPDC059740 TaxID=3346926 RepID=UPI003663325E